MYLKLKYNSTYTLYLIVETHFVLFLNLRKRLRLLNHTEINWKKKRKREKQSKCKSLKNDEGEMNERNKKMS